MYTTLISTEELATRADDSWVVVDCRYDLRDVSWGSGQYRAGHIPRAVYASLSHDLSAPPSGTNGRHPLPCVEDLRSTFSRLGISLGAQVIAYDQDAGMYASRLWWMLRYMGHNAVAVLDGGWAKWVREGRPVSVEEEHAAVAVFSGQRRRDLRLVVDQVASLLDDPSVLLVDARAPERFEGRNETLDRAAGHIPGSLNYFFKRNVTEDGVMFPAETIRAQFQELLDGRAPQDVVMYCGSGVTACHNLVAMEYAGLGGAKLYAGSWSEWSSDPARPIATGPVPGPRTADREAK